ncbi:MAG: hypothetical protein EHM49_00385 [Deltaproteobacteria bacterium]|nr:MAG: hypothetical protein EHM49_00385 [Deltaproteobacteria bacterium]
MAKFDVYLLTPTASWEGIEAPTEEEAINIARESDQLLDYVYQDSGEPYQYIALQTDDDEDMEEVEKTEEADNN